ncbi:Sirohydrochlorin ferrochelatase, chloroplastic [Vitis vinifera]|uniref:Sirohydrochlorin ferrochelatase, chloroplastic n=1 Tax=Vitis vinifera TaxID=29760 RepID=A0A438JIU6_VITVI|nr:Sirohydrochlorin ferrochelatase, chloroplastic [Vitis vinifera]
MDSLSIPCQFTLKRYLPTKGCLAAGNGGLGQQTNGVGDKDGVIIVDHGSRRKESNLMLNEFVTMFRDKTGYLIVEPAHMALSAETSHMVNFRAC